MQVVRVILDNRFVKFLKPYPKVELQPYFSYSFPGARFSPQFRAGHWDGRIRFLKRHKVPTGLFFAHKEKIEQDLSVKFEIENLYQPVLFKVDGVTSEREYQNECTDAMIQAARTVGGGIVLKATGSGKTRTAGQFFSRLIGSGVFIVDELTLLKQAREELSEVLGEEVGEVGDSKFTPRRITVATSQTLALHKDDPKFEPWVQSLKVSIIDELHQAMNKRNFDVVEAMAPPAVFGLTATLELKKKPVRTRAYAIAGPVCYEYPLTQGQEEGYLARGVVVQVSFPLHYLESAYGPGQQSQEYEDNIVHNSARNSKICHLVRVASKLGWYPIVCVERVRHLDILSEALQDLPHAVVCGKKKVEERIASKRKFEKGKLKALLVNKVFQKGINAPRIDVIIDAGAMHSKNRSRQIFGRGSRLCDGKRGLIHFDIADRYEFNKKNRFNKGTKNRYWAFKRNGIPVTTIDSSERAWNIFQFGAKFLEKQLNQAQKQAPKQGNLFPGAPGLKSKS